MAWLAWVLVALAGWPRPPVTNYVVRGYPPPFSRN